MVVDPVAAEIFNKQKEQPANCVCCDCGTDGASWASISHGIYISIGAAGLHRSLGVQVSFVQSTTMDSWRPLHLRMMELGGNQRFADFMSTHGVPEDMPIREKYSTRAAKWYRENLRAEAEGSELPPPLPFGTGHLQTHHVSQSSRQVLDQVFANAPRSGSMNSGGVQKSQTRQRSKRRLTRKSTLKAVPKGLWDRLGATVEQMRHSAPAALGRPGRQDDSGPNGGVAIPPACAKPRINFLSGGHAVELPGRTERARRHTLTATPSSPRSRCMTTDLSLDWLLPPAALPALLTSSRCANAERLQKLSTGKMEGFGSDESCCS